MKFYRVLSWCENSYFHKWDKKHPGVVKNTFIPMVPGEMLTEREKNQYCNHEKHYEVVEVKKNNTYWFFGARFENNTCSSDFIKNI